MKNPTLCLNETPCYGADDVENNPLTISESLSRSGLSLRRTEP